MSENIGQKKERALKIIEIFHQIYADADCTLEYMSPLQLLIATQLAAQCTDARVNMVTPALFKRYPTVHDFACAYPEELSAFIRSTGFYRNKTKNIIACCQKLISDFGGEVPKTMDELLTLPGVGRKTANLVLGDCFGVPGIVVDTHAGRLSRRMGFTKNTDPYKVELDLLKIIPPFEQSSFCHCLVYHGREYCDARKPRCAECPVKDLCPQKIK
ncbi:MAG: endonuclease III [Clostridia bacterium]|nr:endonuclease III [Clostridia bacterium]MBR6523321.1 endonuclease III [Clostridia bacterium]